MPSRISGACNGCRMKKQKCSGDKSGCTQCAAAGIQCTWPQQRKRGPAKGYIEGLEHRLHEAESLLLALLPLVSTEQLNCATEALYNNESTNPNTHPSGSGLNSTRESQSPNPRTMRSSPPILNKKTGIEYWESFPLDTAENIRKWQQDCAMHSTSNHTASGRHSRPGSVDVSRPNHSHSQSHPTSTPTPFRSMSSDSSYRSGTSTPVNIPAQQPSHCQSHTQSTISMDTKPDSSIPQQTQTQTQLKQRHQHQHQQQTHANWQSLSLFSPLPTSDTTDPNSNNVPDSNVDVDVGVGIGIGAEALLLQNFADSNASSSSWPQQSHNAHMAGMSLGMSTNSGTTGVMNDGGAMEIDTGFFANDLQRRLFW